MSNGGKGDDRRPLCVDEATFAANWDRIFNGARLGAETGSNPGNDSSILSAPAIYIDNATGKEVGEDWWPGDPYP